MRSGIKSRHRSEMIYATTQGDIEKQLIKRNTIYSIISNNGIDFQKYISLHIKQHIFLLDQDNTFEYWRVEVYSNSFNTSL